MSANETAEQAAVYAQEIMRQQAIIADLLRALQRIESNAYVYTREHVAIIARDAIAKAAK